VERFIRNEGQEERVVQRRGGTEFTVGPMAAGAILGEESREVRDFVLRQRAIGWVWLSGEVIIAADERSACDHHECLRNLARALSPSSR
jgi:hypothetical protein